MHFEVKVASEENFITMKQIFFQPWLERQTPFTNFSRLETQNLIKFQSKVKYWHLIRELLSKAIKQSSRIIGQTSLPE